LSLPLSVKMYRRRQKIEAAEGGTRRG